MGTYQTTLFPGAPEAQRLLAVNSLGQTVLLTRLLPEDAPQASGLAERLRPEGGADSALLARTLEFGRAGGWLFAAEWARPGWPLSLVLEAARRRSARLGPDLCAWLAAQLSAAAATLGEAGHLRLGPGNLLLRPDGEPYLLGSAWARLLPARPGDLVPEWSGPGRERHADAFAAARLAQLLATLGAPAAPEDWGELPTSLKGPLLRAVSGGLTSASLAQELRTALRDWGRSPSAVGVAAWLRGLELPLPQAPDEYAARLVLEPPREEAAEPSWSESGPALSADGKLDRPERFRQIETRGPPAPAVAPPAPGALELDEQSLAHAFGPPTPESAAPPRPARRLGRLLGAAALGLLVAGVGAAGWLLRPELAGLARSTLPAERPRGAWGTALLSIESTPPGAEIRLGDQLLGQTPYLGDNDLPPGEYRVRLSKPGFQETTLSFEGARDVRLEVRLRPR